jgi:GT2 family glycosyltransferase
MKKKFSIVIALAPYRNAEVLKSLKNLNYDKRKYEIIIEKGYNPSENRNHGIKKAKGEIIWFLDDDAIVEKNVLKNAEDFFNKNNVDIAGGPQLTPKDDKFFAKMFGSAIESFWCSYKMANRYKKGKLNLDASELSLTSANCFVKKSIFKKIKGFDERLWPGEDPEFFSRAKDNRLKIAYSPNLIIYHRRRGNLFSLLKQHYKYGNVRLKKERINKKVINPVMIIPSIFALYVIFLPFLLFISKGFFFPIKLHIIIDIVVALFISIKNNLLYLPFLPFIFFLIHFSYGLGMIVSLFEK